MKTYTLEVVIHEGNDEFWEYLNATNSTGCEDVLEVVKRAMAEYGWFEPWCSIKLIKFENKEES